MPSQRPVQRPINNRQAPPQKQPQKVAVQPYGANAQPKYAPTPAPAPVYGATQTVINPAAVQPTISISPSAITSGFSQQGNNIYYSQQGRQVLVASLQGNELVASGNVVSVPVQSGNQNYGIVEFKPVVSNGSLSLQYSGFKSATIFTTQKAVVYGTTIGITQAGQTEYNPATGQVSVDYGGQSRPINLSVPAPGGAQAATLQFLSGGQVTVSQAPPKLLPGAYAPSPGSSISYSYVLVTVHSAPGKPDLNNPIPGLTGPTGLGTGTSVYSVAKGNSQQQEFIVLPNAGAQQMAASGDYTISGASQQIYKFSAKQTNTPAFTESLPASFTYAPSVASRHQTITAQSLSQFGYPSPVGPHALAIGLEVTAIVEPTLLISYALPTAAVPLITPEDSGAAATIIRGAASAGLGNAALSAGLTQAQSVLETGRPAGIGQTFKSADLGAATGFIAGGAIAGAGAVVSKFAFPLISSDITDVSISYGRPAKATLELAGKVSSVNAESGEAKIIATNVYRNAFTGKLITQTVKGTTPITILSEGSEAENIGVTIGEGFRGDIYNAEGERLGSIVSKQNTVTLSSQQAGSRYSNFVSGPVGRIIRSDAGTLIEGDIGKILAEPAASGISVSQPTFIETPKGSIGATATVGEGMTRGGAYISFKGISFNLGDIPQFSEYSGTGQRYVSQAFALGSGSSSPPRIGSNQGGGSTEASMMAFIRNYFYGGDYYAEGYAPQTTASGAAFPRGALPAVAPPPGGGAPGAIIASGRGAQSVVVQKTATAPLFTRQKYAYSVAFGDFQALAQARAKTSASQSLRSRPVAVQIFRDVYVAPSVFRGVQVNARPVKQVRRPIQIEPEPVKLENKHVNPQMVRNRPVQTFVQNTPFRQRARDIFTPYLAGSGSTSAKPVPNRGNTPAPPPAPGRPSIPRLNINPFATTLLPSQHEKPIRPPARGRLLASFKYTPDITHATLGITGSPTLIGLSRPLPKAARRRR